MTEQRREQLRAIGVGKGFTLYNQGGLELPVLADIDLTLAASECVVLNGPSGVGKSTLLRVLYGNYLVQQGHILVRHLGQVVDMAAAAPRVVLDVRRRTMGFVSQFLRVIPRVATLELVAEPLRRLGVDAAAAHERAAALLDRLAIPRRLWNLPPATFSGGEQQRVNIARGLIAEHPILLLDEPTAALDAANRDAVIELIETARQPGTAIIGIFHDRAVREAVATRTIEIAARDLRRPPASRSRTTRPELVLINARIVTADAVLDGTVMVRGGEIVSVDSGPSKVSGVVDLAGDYLLPGLTELHTDNLEKHVAPRPGVRWPMSAAVLAHDAQIAGSGITTVFDALTVGEVRQDGVRAEMLQSSIEAITAGQREGGCAPSIFSICAARSPTRPSCRRWSD
jgi:alpha-D-ribose 1-methylphosphonate 5-triphosphate synthase subunit PhnL